MKYGYARVSTIEQHEDRQVIALLQQGIHRENIYVDKQTGVNFDRPMYKKLINNLKENDVLYITSIDRFGRNYNEILKQWDYITEEKKVIIKVLEFPKLNFPNIPKELSDFCNKLTLQLLAYSAEQELINMKNYQNEGIEVAKNRNIKFGRPKKNIPKDFDVIVDDYTKGKITLEDALLKCNMSKATFYRKIKEYNL